MNSSFLLSFHENQHSCNEKTLRMNVSELCYRSWHLENMMSRVFNEHLCTVSFSNALFAMLWLSNA